MTDLDAFREHCAAMATAEHKHECLRRERPWLKARPTCGCTGCLTDADRALFARLADEIADYQAAGDEPGLFEEEA